jgi:hypothetical protein
MYLKLLLFLNFFFSPVKMYQCSTKDGLESFIALSVTFKVCGLGSWREGGRKEEGAERGSGRKGGGRWWRSKSRGVERGGGE